MSCTSDHLLSVGGSQGGGVLISRGLDLRSAAGGFARGGVEAGGASCGEGGGQVLWKIEGRGLKAKRDATAP